MMHESSSIIASTSSGRVKTYRPIDDIQTVERVPRRVKRSRKVRMPQIRVYDQDKEHRQIVFGKYMKPDTSNTVLHYIVMPRDLSAKDMHAAFTREFRDHEKVHVMVSKNRITCVEEFML